MLRLNIDAKTVDRCHEIADNITSRVMEELSSLSTVAIERTVARFAGVDGVTGDGVPLPNVLVDHLVQKGKIHDGVAIHLANACLALGKTPVQVAQMVAGGETDISSLEWQGTQEVTKKAREMVQDCLDKIKARRAEREALLEELPVTQTPWLYVICATGNIHEDAVQGRLAASQGADVIAVIRSTGQSLLDFVPHGLTTEGFGGTYATQANFRLMREALDEESRKLGRYVRLVNYCSGLCMPEIAYMGAVERLDMMLNDAMYGILFRDINMERTFVDQNFSRMINAYAGIIINTGEDNYLTTVEAFDAGPQVLASQFMNYHFAKKAGLKDEQIGLGHAFEIDPGIQDELKLRAGHGAPGPPAVPRLPHQVYAAYGAQNRRYFLFPRARFKASTWCQCSQARPSTLWACSLKPSTRPSSKTGTFQSSRLPTCGGLPSTWGTISRSNPAGCLRRVPQASWRTPSKLLEEVNQEGLFAAISEGVFAGVKRQRTGGKGREGVFKKSRWYFNPVEAALRAELLGVS